MDAKRQTSVGYRSLNKALMIRTPGRRERSAISRLSLPPHHPATPLFPSLVAGKKVAADECSQTKWVFASQTTMLMSPNSCTINRLHIGGSRSKLIVTLQMEWAQVSLLVSYLCLHLFFCRAESKSAPTWRNTQGRCFDEVGTLIRLDITQ